MGVKKEYEKFFKRKKNDLCIHNSEDVIMFAKYYQTLQLQQTGVIKSVCNSCGGKKIKLENGFERCKKCQKLFA
jgi:hypothetical protein